MRIALGNDHTILYLKQDIMKHLGSLGHEVIDCGTTFNHRTHYPIYGRDVGLLVATKKVDLGIVICGTGVGITNAATKVKGVRSILTATPSIARKAREEYDINVLGLGGRVSGVGLLIHCINEFLNAKPTKKSLKTEDIRLIDKQLKKANNSKDFYEKIILNWEKGKYTEGKKQEKIQRSLRKI